MTIPLSGMTPLLEVFDMPTALRFYREVLGFEVVASDVPGEHCDWALLGREGVELMLNTAYESHARPDAPERARVAAHQDTTLYFGCRDVDGAYESLKGRGLKVKKPQTAQYGMRQLYFKDPDGYNICLQWPVSDAARAGWRERYGLEV